MVAFYLDWALARTLILPVTATVMQLRGIRRARRFRDLWPVLRRGCFQAGLYVDRAICIRSQSAIHRDALVTSSCGTADRARSSGGTHENRGAIRSRCARRVDLVRRASGRLDAPDEPATLSRGSW